jgi:hypothetical protein
MRCTYELQFICTVQYKPGLGKTYGVKCLPCLEECVCEPPVGGPADQQERQQRRVQEVETQQDGAVPDKQVAGATDISCTWRQIIGLRN